MKRIMITGAGGSIGSHLTTRLRRSGEYDLQPVDIRSVPEMGIEELDVRDLDRLIAATGDVHTIVHLALMLRHDRNTLFSETYATNIQGTFNVFEAARINGVRRVVFASSNHVHGFYGLDEKVGVDAPFRPTNYYGVGKAAGESLGRLYADKYGVSCLVVRIGSFNYGRTPETMRQIRQWLSVDDMVRLFRSCIEADLSVRHLCCYGVSNNSRNIWDISNAREQIGYDPQDDSERYVAQVMAQQPAEGYADDSEYRGGKWATFDE